jgi:hypothetical protein
VPTSVLARTSAWLVAGGWWLVAGAGSVLMRAHHPGVDPYHPPRTLVMVGVPAEFVEDPLPGFIA